MPKVGEWIGGRQWNGTSFGSPGQITVGSHAGQMVSAEVNRQSSVAQGKAPDAIQNYLAGLNGGGGSSGSSSFASPGSMSMPGNTSARTDFVKGLYDDFSKKDAEREAKSNEARGKLVDFYTNLTPVSERFNTFNQEQGVNQQMDLVNALSTQVLDTDKIIGDLEGSVNTRSKDFLITDADRTAILAREREPHQKNLIDLLKQKEREEVGLAGKQQMVSQLLQLSLQDDQMRAKPLELGVDFTEKDREIARNIFESMAGRITEAFSQDESDNEARRMATIKRQQDLEDALTAFERDKEMATFESDLSLRNSLATKGASESKGATKQKAQDRFNGYLAGAKTEYDVWKQIDKLQKSGTASKEELNELWSLHAALAGKVGKGGAVRSGSATNYDDIINNL